MATDVELAITGMTCASCANRIERKLNKLDGVVATVNYATERARVSYPETVSTDELAGHRRGGRLPRRPAPAGGRWARAAGRGRRGAGRAAAAAGGLRGADRAGRPARHGPGVPVRQLAVGVADAGRPGGGVGRLALPPGRLDEPAARHHDHGHAGVDGGAGGVRLVPGRAVLGHGGHDRHDPPVRADRPAHRRPGQHLPRGRGRRDDVPAGRALVREALEAAGGGSPRRAARDGGQGGHPARGRRRAAGAGRPAGRRHALRGPTRREGRHRRGRRAGHVRGGRLDAHR